MPQPDAHTPPLNASWLRAVAAAENTSSTVEFRIRPLAASWRYQMYVIVDKEYVYWWDESMRLQNFRGVTLYQPAGIQNMSHVIAQFDSGAGVEVIANKGHMSVHVYAPYTFVVSWDIDKTFVLLWYILKKKIKITRITLVGCLETTLSKRGTTLQCQTAVSCP